MKRKIKKLKLYLFSGLFLVLVLGGAYARYRHNYSLDRRFFDGISFAMETGKGIESKSAEKPAEKSAEALTESEKIFQEIENVFGEFAGQAKRVACCENQGRPNCSFLDPQKKGPTNDWGVFQIHYPSHKVPIRFLKNFRINIAIAKQLFDEQGWSPWQPSYQCHHLR